VIIIVGVAGAGKSTQSELLASSGHFHSLSVGQLLRQATLEPSLEKEIETGEMLSDDIVIPMVEAKIKEMGDDPELVLDGFPRTTHQVDTILANHQSGKIKITHVIHLVVAEETAYNRLLNRGRSDDYNQAISERFKEYKETILPIIEDFARHGVIVASIDGEQAAKTVHEQLLSVLGK
jgi:adenylate kinase